MATVQVPAGMSAEDARRILNDASPEYLLKKWINGPVPEQALKSWGESDHLGLFKQFLRELTFDRENELEAFDWVTCLQTGVEQCNAITRGEIPSGDVAPLAMTFTLFRLDSEARNERTVPAIPAGF